MSRDVLREVAASTLGAFEEGFYYPPTSVIPKGETDEGSPQLVEGEGKEVRSESEIREEVKEEGTGERGAQQEENKEAKEAVEEQSRVVQGDGTDPETKEAGDPEEFQGRKEKDQGRQPYDLKSKIIYTINHTQYFGPEDERMSRWVDAALQTGESDSDSTVDSNLEKREAKTAKTKIIIGEYSTLVGTRKMREVVQEEERIGVLNFASAKKPGGGFINGSQAQVCFHISFTSIFLIFSIQMSGRIACQVEHALSVSPHL